MAGVIGIVKSRSLIAGALRLATREMGGSKAFRRAMREAQLDPAFYLYRERSPEEMFPWERLDMGFRKDYLYAELQRAQKLLPTVPCFAGCHRCGVC